MSNHHQIQPPAATLSDTDYQVVVRGILTRMTDNPHFPPPWPPMVPALTEVQAEFSLFEAACQAVLSRDLRKIGERDDSRERLNGLLKRLGLYVELVAGDDLAILKSSGFPLRQGPGGGRGSVVEPLSAPSDLRLTHGTRSGTIDVRVARLAGARSYEVQISLAVDPHDAAGWVHGTVSSNSQHILLEGLVPLQHVWVRVRGVNAAGNGLWTEPVRITVL